MYLLFCRDRNRYFAEDAEPDYDSQSPQFETLDEVRNQLIDYHSVDNDVEELKKTPLAELCQIFNWEVHDAISKETIIL